MMAACVRDFLILWNAHRLGIKSALWVLLELRGMNLRCLETVLYLYETTEYKV